MTNPVADAQGDLHWYDEDGLNHREDGPAIVFTNGAKMWCVHGQMHRVGGPALISADGSQTWAEHDQYHREDGPAKIYHDGGYRWYWRGRVHREGGPAVEFVDGDEQYRRWEWRQHGELHRVDGPAITYNLQRAPQWFYRGKVVHDDHQVLPALSLAVREQVMALYTSDDDIAELAAAVLSAAGVTA